LGGSQRSTREAGERKIFPVLSITENHERNWIKIRYTVSKSTLGNITMRKKKGLRSCVFKPKTHVNQGKTQNLTIWATLKSGHQIGILYTV